MDEKLIKDAQYRKGLSIAFFNATNAAIALVASRGIADRVEALNLVVDYRNFFLEEHKNYYATVIANVGQNFNIEETVNKLKNTTTKEELSTVWRSLSEDERHNEEIRKAALEMKETHEKAY